MTAQSVDFTPNPVLSTFTHVGFDDNDVTPIGRILFTVSVGVIPLKLTGDSMTVNVLCTLPVNYGYTVDYVNFMIAGVVGDLVNYNSNAPITINDGASEIQTSQMVSEGTTPNDELGNELKIWRPINISKSVFFNRDGAAPALNALMIDDTTGDATGAASMFAQVAFLQYPIAQVLAAAVHTPTPVRVI